MHMQREGNMKLFSKAPFAVLLMLLPASGMTTGAFAGEKQYGLALLWQIYSRCFSSLIQDRQYGHR